LVDLELTRVCGVATSVELFVPRPLEVSCPPLPVDPLAVCAFSMLLRVSVLRMFPNAEFADSVMSDSMLTESLMVCASFALVSL
jgi:hypothetical protein